MELNIDLIDHDFGEILLEGVSRETALQYIEKLDGEIKEEITEEITLDRIDGGGTMEVVSIWARFPESVKDLQDHFRREKSAAAFWHPDQPEVLEIRKEEAARFEESLED